MSAAGELLGLAPKRGLLCEAFLRWQCRTRQLAMRENMGRPDGAVTPALTPEGESEPMGHIITVLLKRPAHDKTAELRHMVQQTNDPSQRREKALQFFSETYYQKASEFSDMLTATFPPESLGAAHICEHERCKLAFHAYNQSFVLNCKVWQLAENNPYYQATWWHNSLFNPTLPPGTVVLGFEPDWSESSAEPGPPQAA